MIIRDLKLDIVMGNKNPIIDKFNEITRDIKVIKTDVYRDDEQEYILYNQNNKWIFYQDLKNGDFWCNFKLYWSFFRNEFNLEYSEIQEITKYLVEETLKVKVDTPNNQGGVDVLGVEETLKVKVDTPPVLVSFPPCLVEETLKIKVDTPESRYTTYMQLVEETLKIKVDVSVRSIHRDSHVEDTLRLKVDTPVGKLENKFVTVNIN